VNDTEILRGGGDRDRREASLPAISDSVPGRELTEDLGLINFELLRSFAEVSKIGANSSDDVLIS